MHVWYDVLEKLTYLCREKVFTEKDIDKKNKFKDKEWHWTGHFSRAIILEWKMNWSIDSCAKMRADPWYTFTTAANNVSYSLATISSWNLRSQSYGVRMQLVVVDLCQLRAHTSQYLFIKSTTTWNEPPLYLKNIHIGREQLKTGLKTWLFSVCILMKRRLWEHCWEGAYKCHN